MIITLLILILIVLMGGGELVAHLFVWACVLAAALLGLGMIGGLAYVVYALLT